MRPASLTATKDFSSPNTAMVYRTCRNCLFEVSWPMKQTSLSHCPYCQTAYQRPTRLKAMKEFWASVGATVVVCVILLLAVGMLIQLGATLF